MRRSRPSTPLTPVSCGCRGGSCTQESLVSVCGALTMCCVHFCLCDLCTHTFSMLHCLMHSNASAVVPLTSVCAEKEAHRVGPCCSKAAGVGCQWADRLIGRKQATTGISVSNDGALGTCVHALSAQCSSEALALSRAVSGARQRVWVWPPVGLLNFE